MHVARDGGERAVYLDEGALLGDNEGVSRAVERVVAEKAEREGAPDALVGGGQAAHAVAQRPERARDAASLDEPREAVAGAHRGGQGREPGEEGVRPLVGEQEGELLLLAAHDAVGPARDDVLAEYVVRDERGHGPSSRRFREIPRG